MATYDPTALGIKAPSGGFQQGGWYGGRQYWGGTLSDPGSIHPQSNQQGAGQAVSQEVVAQTNPNNVAYVNAERQKASLAPLSIAPAQTTLPGGSFDPSASNAGLGQGASLPQASINLPELYKSLQKDSGVQEAQTQLSNMEKSFIEQKGKINDNPFLSEASRVGRVAKLEQLFNERTANIRGDIATKQADAEMQLNLATKQFDINSQQAQQALTQFNTLLNSGALNNATGEDISAIIRTTGLSGSMIQGAINASKAKDVKTSTIQFDDGTNTGFAVINSQTGDIISKQVIAGSKPTKATGGSGGGTTTAQKTKITTSARSAIAKADSNADKRLSMQEYKDAVAQIMTATGTDFATADDYATTAFTDLGYKKWKW